MLFRSFGLNEKSIQLGKELRKKKNCMVVYFTLNADKGMENRVVSFGGIVRRYTLTLQGGINTKSLKQIGLSSRVKRPVHLLFLGNNERENVKLLISVLRYVQQQKMDCGKIRLLARCSRDVEQSIFKDIQTGEGLHYDVEFFSEAELSARLLIKEAPPYIVMNFDEHGKAKQDFHALVIGFGQVGQQVLRQLVMNGQFYGSKMSITVIDRAMEQISGQFKRRVPGIFSEYDISLKAVDSRSDLFYDLLDKLVPTLQYIVICLGEDDLNDEVSRDLERYFTTSGVERASEKVIMICDNNYVTKAQAGIRFYDSKKHLYHSDILIRNELDERARRVNLSYRESNQEQGDADTLWQTTDYFSRESCRASADFIPALLAMAHIPLEDAVSRERMAPYLDEELLENLAIVEHLRWNAFHYAMGYITMTKEEVCQRHESGIRPIQKDTHSLRHACLVSWDELDHISRLISERTQKTIDYKDYDRKNIDYIARTLKPD